MSNSLRMPPSRAVSPPTTLDGSRRPTLVGDDAPTPSCAKGRLWPGDRVGRYTIVDVLGAGAMGVVYAAYDPELERTVALKLRAPGASERARIRLKREAQAMARVSHENVVAVHDVGLEGNAVYVAMEHVVGRTVTRWVAQERPSWREVLAVFMGVGRGLAAAHAQGVLHRDVKPDNMMVDDRGVGRVMDFGLALPSEDTEASGETSARSDATGAGALLGTPAYMAPEQWSCDVVDARADQFSFCVSLWEALYGERPFAGDGPAEIALAVAQGRRRAPPAGSRVPTRVRKAVERGLSTDRSGRWPSMAALVDALAADPNRRRRRGLALAGGIAVVGLAGFGVRGGAGGAAPCSGGAAQLRGVWDDARREEARAAFSATAAEQAESLYAGSAAQLDAYAFRWTQTYTEACEATTLRGEQSTAVMDRRMACLQRAKAQLGAVAEVLATADAAVVRRAQGLVANLPPLRRCMDVDTLETGIDPPRGAEAEVVAGVRALLVEARAEGDAGRYDVARARLRSAEADAAGLEYAPVLAELALAKGILAELVGDYSESEADFRRALRAATATGHREVMQHAVLRLMFVVGFRLSRHEEALALRPLAAGIAEGRPHVEVRVQGQVAMLLAAKGELGEAAEILTHTLATRIRLLGEKDRDVAKNLNDLAMVKRRQGENAEAEQLQRRALAIHEETLGPDHPFTAENLHNLGNLLQMEGEYEEAIRLHRQAHAIFEASLGDEHPHALTSLRSLGDALQHSGDHDEAARLLRRALAIEEKLQGARHPNVAATLVQLAGVELERGADGEATALAERAVSIHEATGDQPVELSAARFMLARALGPADPRAIDLARRARDALRENGGEGSKRLREIEAWLGRVGAPAQ